MGCASSKDGEVVVVEPPPTKDVAQPIAAHKPAKSPKAYHSDVDNDSAPVISGLIHRADVKELHHKYDTSKATELGRGACGSVVAVRQKATGYMFAMKTVSFESMDTNSFDELRVEIDVQKKLDHPNIARILESFEDQKNGVMYIVMELCGGGSLVSRMRKHRHGYSERAAATIIEKMLSAVVYCHHHGVVHRDIKLDNIMYESEAEDGELKLIDFGFAQQVKRGNEGMFDQLGTPSYMAPELWADYEVEYNSSVDMWAVGVLTYLLLCGRRPFDHPNRAEKKRMIEKDPLQFPSPAWDKISSEAKDFCSSLMKKRPKDRMSASEAIKHPWIKKSSTVHAGNDGAQELLAHQAIFDSLEAYEHADDLCRLSLQVMAFSTPPDKVDELRTVFQRIDEDDSGTISKEEFMKAMTSHPELTNERLEHLFSSLDTQSKGEIDYSQFIAATLGSQQRLATGSSILAAFNTLDFDHDGFISQSDLQEAFSGQLDSAMIDKLLSHRDASGRVNFDSFRSSIVALLQESDHAEHAQSVIDALSPKQFTSRSKDRKLKEVQANYSSGSGSR